MMPTMTRQQFEELSFEEFMEWARENIDDITDEDTLIQFAKDKIDDDSFNVAIHVLTAIWENGVPDVEDWRYDYSMGTCETPIPITCKEDLEDLIDFGEDEEEAFDFIDYYEARWSGSDTCDDPEVTEEYLAYYKKDGED